MGHNWDGASIGHCRVRLWSAGETLAVLHIGFAYCLFLDPAGMLVMIISMAGKEVWGRATRPRACHYRTTALQ